MTGSVVSVVSVDGGDEHRPRFGRRRRLGYPIN
jgi:hypothetical protein